MKIRLQVNLLGLVEFGLKGREHGVGRSYKETGNLLFSKFCLMNQDSSRPRFYPVEMIIQFH